MTLQEQAPKLWDMDRDKDISSVQPDTTSASSQIKGFAGKGAIGPQSG